MTRRELPRAGQRVHVHAFGAWRTGVVTGLDGGKVVVRFGRNRLGAAAERSFPPAGVLPADGIALVPVRELRPGDVVVVAGQSKTVAGVWRHPHRRRRRMEVTYRDGDVVALPAVTRLRVRVPRSGEG
jgi:hypothetical protein